MTETTHGALTAAATKLQDVAQITPKVQVPEGTRETRTANVETSAKSDGSRKSALTQKAAQIEV